MLVDQNLAGNFDRELLALNNAKEPLFNFEVDVQVSKVLQLLDQPDDGLLGFRVFQGMVLNRERS